MEDLPLGRISALVPEFAVKDLPLGRTLMMKRKNKIRDSSLKVKSRDQQSDVIFILLKIRLLIIRLGENIVNIKLISIHFYLKLLVHKNPLPTDHHSSAQSPA